MTIDGDNCTDLTSELSKIKIRVTRIRATRGKTVYTGFEDVWDLT